MSILINKNTRLLVQGITGNEGLFHTTHMVEYGTNVVAGVTPGKGGEWVMDGKIPVFDSVKLAVDATGANATVIFVPSRGAPDAMFEAADAGIPLIVCITEGVAVQDMMRVRNYIDQKKVRLLGPELPGHTHARRMQGRDHSRRYCDPRQCRRCFTLGHADVRSALCAQAAELGRIHMRGNWRRPDQRHEFHQCARNVRA